MLWFDGSLVLALSVSSCRAEFKSYRDQCTVCVACLHCSEYGERCCAEPTGGHPASRVCCGPLVFRITQLMHDCRLASHAGVVLVLRDVANAVGAESAVSLAIQRRSTSAHCQMWMWRKRRVADKHLAALRMR